MATIRLSIIGTLLAGLFSCDSNPPSQPVCRLHSDHINYSSTGNAGCIVPIGDKVLALVHRDTGKYDTPGGLAVPGEMSQCTAHRLTWEETGFNVEVSKLLGVANNGFKFYQCQLPQDSGVGLVEFPVPGWAQNKVSKIILVDPYETGINDWRYPDQLMEIRDMLIKID